MRKTKRRRRVLGPVADPKVREAVRLLARGLPDLPRGSESRKRVVDTLWAFRDTLWALQQEALQEAIMPYAGMASQGSHRGGKRGKRKGRKARRGRRK